MKNEHILALSLVTVGVGYILYKKGVFNKFITPKTVVSAQDAQLTQDALLTVAKQAQISQTEISNPTSQKAKIAVIQMDLGVSPDGIVGPNTLAALKLKYPLIKTLDSDTINALWTYIKSGKSIIQTPTA